MSCAVTWHVHFFDRLWMCLQKSDLCTAVLFLASRRTIALCARPAVPFPLSVGFSRSLLLSSRASSAVSSAGPFWGTRFSDRGRSRTSAAVVCCGVGVRRILLSGYERGESHSRALLALSPSCQVGYMPAAVFLLFVLTHAPCQRVIFP